MESTEMISPSNCSARRNAISVLPTAVGPASNSSGAFMAGLRQRTPQREKQDQTRSKNTGADQMRLRRPATVQDRVIAAEKFHHRTQHGVTHQIRGEDLPIEFAPGKKPCKEQV